jgi:phosphate transport system substrate-binding protein
MRWRKDTLRSTKRSLTVLAGLVAALALLAAACSSDNSTTTTASSGGSGTTLAGANLDCGAASGTLNGSGSTFQKAFNDEAIAQLPDTSPDLTVNYAGGGSGAGKTQLASNPPDYAFSGTDSTVKPEDLPTFQGGPILYFPTVVAPITVSYNLSGVSELNLSPEALAKIFQTDITTWNDPAIAADNPDASLPSTPIVVARRAEASGTTSNFTKFLDNAAQGTWTLGSTDSPSWPANTQAGQGNTGVAQIVKDTTGAIGYVDFSDANATGLSTASVKNKAGEFVAPSLEAASAAVANTTINPDLTYNPINAPGADSYPITSPTWIILYSTQPNDGMVLAQQCWLNFLLTSGQGFAESVDYAPLPSSLQSQAVAQLSKITTG